MIKIDKEGFRRFILKAGNRGYVSDASVVYRGVIAKPEFTSDLDDALVLREEDPKAMGQLEMLRRLYNVTLVQVDRTITILT